VDADLWGTAKFVDSVRLPYIAPSLGGVDSLIEQPTVISYWDQVSCPDAICPWTTFFQAFLSKLRLPSASPVTGCLQFCLAMRSYVCLISVVVMQGPEKRAEYGIKDNLIRFSCGLESAEDIWQDLLQALARI
jgi:cystathionine gamma-synthase